MALWAKVAVDFFDHPQVVTLSEQQQVRYLRMILYSQRHETDGFIPYGAMRACHTNARHMQAMATAGLITEVDGGWHITGFLNHQRSREELESARQVSSEKARKAARARWDRPGRAPLEAVQ
jgi:hypothetical protein